MYQILSGRTKQDLLDLLNGVIVGKVNLVNGAEVNTLQLTFTAPAAVVVTFNDANTVTLEQIVNEINGAAGLAGVASICTVKTGTVAQGRLPQVDRRLRLVDPAGVAVTIDLGASDAEVLLGFDTQNNSGALIAFTRINGGVSQDISGHYFALVAP